MERRTTSNGDLDLDALPDEAFAALSRCRTVVADSVGGIHLLSRTAATNPRVTKGWADTGYRTKAIDHGARLGIDVEVIQRDPGVK
ncbi:hypothetical protein OG787_45855 [Streptomyces sp. NBC_00075]